MDAVIQMLKDRNIALTRELDRSNHDIEELKIRLNQMDDRLKRLEQRENRSNDDGR